jgi:hypothetical protein
MSYTAQLGHGIVQLAYDLMQFCFLVRRRTIIGLPGEVDFDTGQHTAEAVVKVLCQPSALLLFALKHRLAKLQSLLLLNILEFLQVVQFFLSQQALIVAVILQGQLMLRSAGICWLILTAS